jgi:hypothetical protein
MYPFFSSTSRSWSRVRDFDINIRTFANVRLITADFSWMNDLWSRLLFHLDWPLRLVEDSHENLERTRLPFSASLGVDGAKETLSRSLVSNDRDLRTVLNFRDLCVSADSRVSWFSPAEFENKGRPVPIFHAALIAILPSLSVTSLRMCSELCHFYPRVEFNYSVRRGGLQTQNAHIGDLTYRHQHHLHTGFLERRSIIASIILSSTTCDAAGITDRVHLAAKIRLSIHHS